MSDILNKLENLRDSDYVPMHMPGSKRNTRLISMPDPYGIDITEIDDFDNMHNAGGIIKEGFLKASRLFGADVTYFLVNGSSAGIMAAICGATRKGDKVIVARNVHRCVTNAIYLNELKPIYVYPEIDGENGICKGILNKQIEEIFNTEKDNISAVIITSPTYEGVVSQVREIAKTAHGHNAVLIVDEAHGAHFNFHDRFPESAVNQGADAVIQSIHKTLPALTQTALLHINGNLIDRDRVKFYWDIFQTTSPSYVLMAGIDRCLNLLQENGEVLFMDYVERLSKLRERLSDLKVLKLYDTDDISKIVILAPDGKQLYDILREKYHIQLEMASVRYVIAMTSVADTDEYYDRFADAVTETDMQMYEENNCLNGKQALVQKVCRVTVANEKMSMYEAVCSDHEAVNLSDSVGRVAAASVCFYPPGIAVVNPGEIITGEIVEYIRAGIDAGLESIGLKAFNQQNDLDKYNRDNEEKILCLR